MDPMDCYIQDDLDDDSRQLAEAAYERDLASQITYSAALEARVAELEAQLAGMGWRPITERPAEREMRVVLARPSYKEWEYRPALWTAWEEEYWVTGDLVQSRITGWYFEDENAAEMIDAIDEGYTHWRELTPPD